MSEANSCVQSATKKEVLARIRRSLSYVAWNLAAYQIFIPNIANRYFFPKPPAGFRVENRERGQQVLR